jgi:hypothetical protein
VNHYAAIDVSLELSSVCIVDATGKVVKEAKVETHPEAPVNFSPPQLESSCTNAGDDAHLAISGVIAAGRFPKRTGPLSSWSSPA